MTTFDELAEMLAELKGARASVLWALSLAGRPLSQGELLALTGYSRKPVRRAVRELLAQGLIQRDGPRVLALTDNWPYRVVEKTRAAGERPAEGDRPGAPGESAAPAYESPGRQADNAREIHLRQELEARRQAFLAEKMAAASAGLAAEAATASAGGHNALANDPTDRESGPSDPQQRSVVVDPDPDQLDDQQQQQIPAGATQLAALLRLMGVNGRAYRRLAQRADLAARPEVVLAWWWYYRVQEGVRNPAGAAISRLDAHDRPPEGYLVLARLWPTLDDELREELESLVLHNWSAEQIAARLRPECPGLTAGAVLAFMTLSLEELGL
ncbi:MAG: helix-turn-helix domain-containing protein [Chloroflexota bacterium]|jgi:hypothetical protein